MYRSSLNLDKSITFGVEIEFQDADREWAIYKLYEWNQLNHKNRAFDWTMTADDTIITHKDGVAYGGEIASFILRDEISTWRYLKEICIMLENLGAKATDLTGGHIHFGAHIFGEDVKKWFNFIKLWLAYEPIIYKFSYNGQKPRTAIKEYAKPVYDVYYPVLKENLKYIDQMSMLKFSVLFELESKSFGLNLSDVNFPTLTYGNTLEIRCPNGTLNYEVWQNNINFFAKLLLYSASAQFDDSLIMSKIEEKNTDEDAIELANLIYSQKSEKNSFLKQYYK